MGSIVREGVLRPEKLLPERKGEFLRPLCTAPTSSLCLVPWYEERGPGLGGWVQVLHTELCIP